MEQRHLGIALQIRCRVELRDVSQMVPAFGDLGFESALAKMLCQYRQDIVSPGCRVTPDGLNRQGVSSHPDAPRQRAIVRGEVFPVAIDGRENVVIGQVEN